MLDSAQLKNRLQGLEQEDLLRTLSPCLSISGSRVQRESGEMVNFVSNNYLGLCGHPEIVAGSLQAIEAWGTGATGSRLLGGDLLLHHSVENRLAQFKGTESALFFNTGYMANLGIISTLASPGTEVFADRLIHASFLDGVKLSGAKLHRFRHNDPNDLRLRLRKRNSANCLVVVESVYSMDGDLAPLAEICAVAKECEAILIVDEAHADGVFGPLGRGRLAEKGLETHVDAVVGTFGKAYACAGAAVWCCKNLRDWMINTCRPFIFSTAQPPAVLGSVLSALEVSIREDWRRTRLQDLALKLRNQLLDEGFDIGQSQSQIVPVILGSNARAISAAQYLHKQGVWAAAIRHPSVPRGSARLRINVCATHTNDEINALVHGLKQWRQEFV